MSEAFPGASSFEDRHGKTRWRYRHRGKTTILPGDPADPRFREHYDAAVEGRSPRVAVIVPHPRTCLPQSFADAWRKLKGSLEWLNLDLATKTKNAALIEDFLTSPVVEGAHDTWGDMPVADIKRRHLKKILADRIDTPHKAKHLLTAIRKLIYVAIDEEWRDDDPSHRMRWRPEYKGWKAWPLPAMEQYEAHWQPGTAARTAYALALWLGNRRGDVASLDWSQRATRTIVIDGQIRIVVGFDLVQGKTGKMLFLPETPMLAEALAPIEARVGTVLKTAYGKPFSAKSLTGMMAHWTRLAGLPAGLTMHGLRKSLGKALAEAEATTRQIMEALGHDDIAHAELYSREAEQVRLAVAGMDRVVKMRRG